MFAHIRKAQKIMEKEDISNRLIEVSYNAQQVSIFLDSFKSLNLNPVFQRNSIWKIDDRKKFIKTILEGMPCPTVFLFERWDNKKKKVIKDVIDGKQRLETIFLFCGKLSPDKLLIDPDKKKYIKKWLKDFRYSALLQEQIRTFSNFSIPVGHIKLKDTSDGSDQGIGDVIEAFVRINTQGRPLTKQEQTNARYIFSPTLTLSKSLIKDFHKIFVMSHDQKSHMKDAEITLELVLSLWKKEILNKKSAITKALKNEHITNKELKDIKKRYRAICGLFKKLNLGNNTRFKRKTSDFYSLFIAFMELSQSKINFDKKGFEHANKELSKFSTEIAKISDAYQRKDFRYLKKVASSPHYKYWVTTQSNTDSKENRKIRSEILKEILSRSFKGKKDKNRFFNVNLKEQVWQNSKSKDKKCSYPGCGRILTWETATIDHIIPWSQGGPTIISNAQLMCRVHNSMKKGKDFSKCFVSVK